MTFEILDQATDDVIIGLPDFKRLGYALSGVPVKPPCVTATVHFIENRKYSIQFDVWECVADF